MSFFFHPEAEQEFIEAVAYYEGCEAGLGLDFSREVYAGIQVAIEYRVMWPEIEEGVRRCLIQRFPYGVLYGINPDGIFILAVMHLHRAPGYWKHRHRPSGSK
jgi:hypothetical protein